MRMSPARLVPPIRPTPSLTHTSVEKQPCLVHTVRFCFLNVGFRFAKICELDPKCSFGFGESQATPEPGLTRLRHAVNDVF